MLEITFSTDASNLLNIIVDLFTYTPIKSFMLITEIYRVADNSFRLIQCSNSNPTTSSTFLHLRPQASFYPPSVSLIDHSLLKNIPVQEETVIIKKCYFLFHTLGRKILTRDIFKFENLFDRKFYLIVI